MDSLPLEVLWLLLDSLSSCDVSKLSATCKSLHFKLLPFLYRHLRINFRHGRESKRSLHILRVMHQRPYLISLIRNIEIIDQEFGSWSDGQSNLLDIALSSVMKYPSKILSFSTAVHWVPRETVFRNLTSLTYLGIHTDTEAAWVRWHLQNCSRLAELRLSFPPYGPRLANDCFDITTLSHVRKLSLDCVPLYNWMKQPKWRLQLLDLRLCPGSGGFVKQMMLTEQFRHLRVFRLAGHLTPDLLQILVFHLCRAPLLLEMCLRVGNIYQPINLAPYFKYSPSLRVLVIDVRQNIALPETAFKSGIRELEAIVQACPSLEFLGLPIHLGNPHFRRYQRVKLSVSFFFPSSKIIQRILSLTYIYSGKHQVPPRLPPRHPFERRLHSDKTSDKRCQTPS